MSSTNHTTNYNLPQFVGTDKPAWLGDINPAMSAIDAQMKLNADAASAASGAAATADGKAVAAGDAASTADSKAVTAQNTADGAVTRINALEQALNLTSFQNMAAADVPAFAPVASQLRTAGFGLTLAQNSDGSIFKFYGDVVYGAVSVSVSIPHVDVPGLTGIKGYKTMIMTSTPSKAYFIKNAGEVSTYANNVVTDTQPIGIAVGSDGYVYFDATTYQGTPQIAAGVEVRYSFYPCLFFNKSFGDQPE